MRGLSGRARLVPGVADGDSGERGAVRQMLVEQRCPRVHFVVLHREEGADAQVEHLVSAAAEDVVDAPEHVVQLVRVAPCVLVQHTEVLDTAERARRVGARHEGTEEERRRHIMSVSEVLRRADADAGAIVRDRPSAQRTSRVETPVEDGDAQVGVDRVFDGQRRRGEAG